MMSFLKTLSVLREKLLLVPMSGYSLYCNHYLLQEETSLTGLSNTQIYKYSNANIFDI